jgi:hypothetical protein
VLAELRIGESRMRSHDRRSRQLIELGIENVTATHSPANQNSGARLRIETCRIGAEA